MAFEVNGGEVALRRVGSHRVVDDALRFQALRSGVRDSYCDVGFSTREVRQFIGKDELEVDFRICGRELGDIGHDQAKCRCAGSRDPQIPSWLSVSVLDAAPYAVHLLLDSERGGHKLLAGGGHHGTSPSLREESEGDDESDAEGPVP